MSSPEQTVLYEVRGHVAVITLNRPEARNAVSADLARGLEAAVDRMEADDEVWVGVLRANTEGQSRPVFCAGMDLKALERGEGRGSSTERGGFAGFVYRERRKPVIAAVDGLATAGGCEIVLSTDIVVASEAASFGLAEVSRGLIAGAGGLFRLPRQIGRSAAMDVVLTAEPLSAERAYQLGLVARLVPAGTAFEAAMEVAQRIIRNAPLAVWESRRIVLAADTASDADLRAMEAAGSRTVQASDDLREGLRAFIEKRPPRWTGR